MQTRPPRADDEAPSFEEAEQTQALIASLRGFMLNRDRDSPPQRRDVHTKMHALLRAEFTVLPDLPPDLQVGLFAQPATYKAWVRYSNSAETIAKDSKGDIRGMAIKLMGVPGAKLLQADATTHDLLLASAPVFAPSTVAGVGELAAAVIAGVWAKLVFAITHPRVGWILFKSMARHANLLQVRYFSAVPYAFGEQAVKYVATPRVTTPDAMPSFAPPGFLRQVAVDQLKQGDAVFDFAVQFQRDEACMPIEDSTREWSLELSPPRKVATLRILPQVFDTPAIDSYGENLSFTPWHALPEHRPLGSINRARRAIYDALSTVRHDANAEPRREPADWEV